MCFYWPREALEGPNENTANRSAGDVKAVYLNGRQPGVKLLDRVRDALHVGPYALETEKAYVNAQADGGTVVQIGSADQGMLPPARG
jgi:hypothetical protein